MRDLPLSHALPCAHARFIKGVLDDLADLDVGLNEEIVKGVDLRRTRLATPADPDDFGISSGLFQNMCHLNSDIVAQHLGFRQVRGWIVMDRCLVLHSVNLVKGRLACFTPNGLNGPFPFVEDDRVFVKWERGNGSVMISRESDPPAEGVRCAFLHASQAASASLRLAKMLRSGADPEFVARSMSSLVTGRLRVLEPMNEKANASARPPLC